MYKRRKRTQEANEELMKFIWDSEDSDNESSEEEEEDDNPPKKKTKYQEKEPTPKRYFRCPVDGTLKVMGPQDTSWYANYVLHPDVESSRFKTKF